MNKYGKLLTASVIFVMCCTVGYREYKQRKVTSEEIMMKDTE